MYGVEGNQLAVKPLHLTEVRDRIGIGNVLTQAIRGHRPIPIVRGAKDLAMLLGLEELAELVHHLSFHPEVFREDSAISVWLPEFQLYGRGRTLAAAKEDLIHEVREYIAEYLDEIQVYRAAPNRRSHFGHLIKALIADLSGELEHVVFPGPPESLETKEEVIATANIR